MANINFSERWRSAMVPIFVGVATAGILLNREPQIVEAQVAQPITDCTKTITLSRNHVDFLGVTRALKTDQEIACNIDGKAEKSIALNMKPRLDELAVKNDKYYAFGFALAAGVSGLLFGAFVGRVSRRARGIDN